MRAKSFEPLLSTFLIWHVEIKVLQQQKIVPRPYQDRATRALVSSRSHTGLIVCRRLLKPHSIALLRHSSSVKLHAIASLEQLSKLFYLRVILALPII